MASAAHLGAFIELGTFIGRHLEKKHADNEPWHAALDDALQQSEIANKWYTQDNLRFALQHWSRLLRGSALSQWIKAYPTLPTISPKKVAIIMAGNIPLVGFHDFLSVLLSGHQVLVKLASSDTALLPFLTTFLIDQDPELAKKIEFTQGSLTGFDAVIATGSNNTGRYFDHYFSKYPSIIRKNRNSVAILSGDEDRQQLKALSEDVFRYFGLGCRSVSKVFVPEGYDFDQLFAAFFEWRHVLEHHKYLNNYDYNKAVYLMSNSNLLDNGFLILKEDNGFGSPIAALFFEHYADKDTLLERLQSEKESLQCVVSHGLTDTEIPFGQTQIPGLADYADGKDTMFFLSVL